MQAGANDTWRGEFTVTSLGRWEYVVHASIDAFASWQQTLRRRVEASQDEDVAVELEVGAALLLNLADGIPPREAEGLRSAAARLTGGTRPAAVAAALSAQLRSEVERLGGESGGCASAVFPVQVEPVRARYGAWYEFFPRSAACGHHANLREAESRLDYAASMGFNVVYLPPIHPIGRTNRKGPNNSLRPEPDDPGSPWAIGGAEGGHRALHPLLGTMEDFHHFLEHARGLGLEVAMDLAFQCSPDHPAVREHPEWFWRRPDGSVRFAENPPKKYEDIFPFNFGCEAWHELWDELRDTVLFWAAQGVSIFRVDNPHTKPVAFWEWLIAEVREQHPETVFLAEAFARPAMLHMLAKVGFSQSYTYFTWRNTARELRDYLTELCCSPAREYLRPNLWANTPDIISEYLQSGGRNGFAIRLILAATLGANYGIYGPAFELCDDNPLRPGSEEYLDSEKYQLRCWDIEDARSLRPLITRVNRIRAEHVSLQADWSLTFHESDNPSLLSYSKSDPETGDTVLMVVNLDPHYTQSGFITLAASVGTEPGSYQVHDLLTGARYLWSGTRNFVSLDPATTPAHIFSLRRKVRSEHDFEYFA